MNIELSKRYFKSLRSFVKNNKRNAQNTKKALSLLYTNPKHPSLHLEKLQGMKIWTIRVDRGNRIFLQIINKNTVLLLDIGKHDKYKEY